MTPYSIFAKYYDLLTGDVDYRGRAEYLHSIFIKHGLRPEIVLDLACGTGSMSMELARAGYEVIGVDRSPQMLSEATRKAGSANERVMFICQDMTDLDLYGTVDAAVCTLDGINHLSAPAKVLKTFNRVSLFLNPGGLFVFDLNSPFKISDILGNNTFVYDYDEIYCVWQNTYRPSTKTCRFDLTFYEPCDGLYRRYDEQFAERAYSTRQIGKMLDKAGLALEAVYSDMDFEQPDSRSERIIYVARKGENNGDNC